MQSSFTRSMECLMIWGLVKSNFSNHTGFSSYAFCLKLISPAHKLVCKYVTVSCPSIGYYRVYSREDREECQTLKSTILLDEIERNLHSKDDYHACHQYIFDVIPAFKEFLKFHVVPTVGDWPTWYIKRRLFAMLHSNKRSHP